MTYDQIAKLLRDATSLRALNDAAQQIQHAQRGDLPRLNKIFKRRHDELKGRQ